MKRTGCLVVSALLLTAFAQSAGAADRFDVKLPADRQVVHVLNRLTFGGTPGDVEQVRRLGIDAWIDQQLHPDKLTENPALDARLREFQTLKLSMWQILEKYPVANAAFVAAPPSLKALQALPPQQRTALTTCSVSERRDIFAKMDPETRRLVLAAAPPPMLEGLPDDLIKEGADARKAEQEARQKEFRRLMPPITELLTQDQIRVVFNGTVDEKLALLDSLDADKRRQVVRTFPPQAYANL